MPKETTVTFPDILNELGIPHLSEGHEHCRPGWIQLDCPFCSKDWKHWRLGYNLQWHYMSCWSCGKHSVASSLVEATGKSYGLVKELLERVDRVFSTDKPVECGKLRLPAGLGPLLPAHKRYLKERGFNPDHLEREWGLQGIGVAARLQWRVFIPIIHSGKTVSWTTRTIGTEGKRYINASPSEESMRAKDVLYGIDKCHHAILVTEGCFDAMRIGPGAVATMGLSYTKSQLNTIARFPVRGIVFDNEEGAQERAKKLCQDLSLFPGTTTRVEIDSPDPGSASKKEVQLLRKAFLE